MARRELTAHLDDTDGSPAAETVRFGLDGDSYEIDLSAAHAEELRTVLARFVAGGRRLGRLTRAAPRRVVTTEADPTAVRAWARAHGIDVSPRGRIPATVLERYRAAGN